MTTSLEAEIDKVVQQIEQLKKDGDPDGRVGDLNEYLRVLYMRLKTQLHEGQKD